MTSRYLDSVNCPNCGEVDQVCYMPHHLGADTDIPGDYMCDACDARWEEHEWEDEIYPRRCKGCGRIPPDHRSAGFTFTRWRDDHCPECRLSAESAEQSVYEHRMAFYHNSPLSALLERDL